MTILNKGAHGRRSGGHAAFTVHDFCGNTNAHGVPFCERRYWFCCLLEDKIRPTLVKAAPSVIHPEALHILVGQSISAHCTIHKG
ncbi:MAG: hypothetical protein ACTIIK_01465, partial [Corynebacterium casei]|uniref:hypothetical protein n=1 Tax=Corynebacterium casei TaxID=160386 RepID=UPI002648FA54